MANERMKAYITQTQFTLKVYISSSRVSIGESIHYVLKIEPETGLGDNLCHLLTCKVLQVEGTIDRSSHILLTNSNY